MELRLRDHLAKLFNAQHPSKDVRKNLRAMAKLLKEASRVKTVLSANADHMAQVGGADTGWLGPASLIEGLKSIRSLPWVAGFHRSSSPGLQRAEVG